MPSQPLTALLQHLRQLTGTGAASAEHADGPLLERFATAGDQSAFEALVRRHGPMVLGLCRRVLNDADDADDAFQAAFLVLARKAGSIRTHSSVASWLYGVALRVARKAKVAAARRRARERKVAAMRAEGEATAPCWADLRPLLDEELGCLAEKYRAPMVLCYLEGKTNDEAAEQLGWTKGTVSGRLARARDQLRVRLARRGLTVASAALAALLAENAAATAAVPAALLQAAGRSAQAIAAGATTSGGMPAAVVALADSTIRTLGLEKLRWAAVVLVALLALGLGTVFGLDRMHSAGSEATAAEPAVVYLTDMSEAALDIPRAGYLERGATVQGVRYPRALALHPPTNGRSSITYRLDRKFRLFQADVGLRDNPQPDRSGVLTFKVYGDGRALWQSKPFKGPGVTEECTVNVEGIDRLELQVHCTLWSTYAWTTWIDPRVSR